MIALIPVLLLILASMILAPKLRMRSSVLYAILLFGALDIVYLGALVGLLRPAAWLVFGLLFLLVLLFLGKYRGESFARLRQQGDLYLALNGITSGLFALIFTIQQPRFYYWDEFSFWGPAARYMKYYHQLHTAAPNPYQTFWKYPDGSSVLNYFFSFFTAHFQEAVMLLSYALLYIAVFSLAASVVQEKTKNHVLGVSCYFLLFLSPFTSLIHTYVPDYSSLLYAYGTIMPDFNLAVMLLGAFALFLYRPRQPWFLLALFYMYYIKRAGSIFVLLAICLIGCLVFFGLPRIPAGLKKVCMAFLLLILLPLAWYGLIGPRPTSAAPAAPVVTDAPAEPSASDSSWLENFREEHPDSPLAVFFPQLGSQRYHEVLRIITEHFYHNHETIFGPDLLLIVALLALGLFTAWGSAPGQRMGMAGLSLGLTAGCFLYSRIVAHQAQGFANQMVEYARYMQSYYFGWMFVALVLFLMAPHVLVHIKKILLCLLLTIMLVHIQQDGLDYTVFSAPQNAYAGSARIEEELAPIREIVQPDENVYLIYKHLDTETYIKYQYAFLPIFAGYDPAEPEVDFTMNYRIEYDDNDLTYKSQTVEAFARIMQENFDYIYVIEPDGEMQASYASLFSDGMTAGQLYRVTQDAIPMQALLP